MMQDMHSDTTRKQTRFSPYAETSAQRRASARKYDDLCFEIRQGFRVAQQDAYEQWAALDEELGEIPPI
jgi:hypothetical protein